MHYDILRNKALKSLEQLTDETWTDFNPHDPGLTILEQLCYAISDLAYRMEHPIPDLLAEGGADPYASLPAPEAILGCHAVTPLDLRKVVIDVEGVRNAWVEPVGPAPAAELFLAPDRREIGRGVGPEGSEPLALRGLLRVRIEPIGPGDLDLRMRVARRLLEHRNLCEDFAEIRLLEPEPIRIVATVDIEPRADADRIHGEILQSLSNHLSPPVEFSSWQQMLDRGLSVDQVLDGPGLDHGFLDGATLAAFKRHGALHTSDLIRVISNIDGVRAVNHVEMASGGSTEAWSLVLDPDRFPWLDAQACEISLQSAGKVHLLEQSRAAEKHAIWLEEEGKARLRKRQRSQRSEPSLSRPPGRNRRVGHYRSIQHQFPAIYGIGEMGLAASASSQRRGRAKQLQAYLSLFDQLLAHHAEQIANVGTLFSFGRPNDQTYFGRPLDDPDLDFEAIRVRGAEEHADRVQQLIAEADSEERSHRFFDHLLARFGEELPRGVDKAAFLQKIAELGSRRGTGFDYLNSEPGTEAAGLEHRLRLMLDLHEDRGEDLVLVEYLLLRPIAADPEGVPLMAEAAYQDPFSLRLGFVLPISDRFADSNARFTAERIARSEAPAHLAVHFHWLDAEAWTSFRSAWSTWLQELGDCARQWLLEPANAAASSTHATFAYRAARDRILDLLGLAETYAIGDSHPTLITPTDEPWVRSDQQASVRLELTQAEAEYQIFGRPLRTRDFLVGGAEPAGAGEVLTIPIPGASPVRIALPTLSMGAEVPEGFTPGSEPMTGTGGELTLPLFAAADDALLLVRAREHFEIDGHAHHTDTWLDPALVLLLAPNPEPALELRLEMETAKTASRLRVAGGEKGTFYHFHRAEPDGAEGPEIALPAYFHRPEDGVGHDRLGVDLVVLGQSVSEPPVLALDSLSLDLELQVRARRARTGLTVSLKEGAYLFGLPTIESVPNPVSPDEKARIVVRSSREGEKYQPFRAGQPIKAHRYGNGDDLPFLTHPVTKDTLVEVHVTRVSAPGLPVLAVFPLWIRVLRENEG